MFFWKEKKINNLVFIVGCPRSGTSWTWGLLSSFREIEPMLIEDFPPLMAQSDIKQMKTDRGFVTTETGLFHRNLSDQEIRQSIRRKMKQYPDALILEKTPANALKLDRITTLFPNAKIVHLLRDPRAVINSMLQSTFSSGYKIAEKLDEAINLYRIYFEATEPYKEHQNLIRLKYESLSEQPTEELSNLCGFIGLDKPIDEIEKIVKQNKGKAQTIASNDFRKGKIDSYKEELDMQDILQIEQTLADIFKQYNYRLKN